MSGRFVFPADGGVLNPTQLHKNPNKPSHLQHSQRSADWFRVYLKLKPLRHDDDKVKPEPADIWYCGADSDAAKRPVFDKVKVRLCCSLLSFPRKLLLFFLPGRFLGEIILFVGNPNFLIVIVCFGYLFASLRSFFTQAVGRRRRVHLLHLQDGML
jgi:hypothetical protein